MTESAKRSTKEHLINELREFAGIFIYLAVNFILLSTFKCVILIQLGVNNFAHAYTVAVIEALGLGKIVLLGQRLPILNMFERKPIALSCMFEAAVMAVLVFFGGELEEKIFAHHAADAVMKHRTVFAISHMVVLFMVFYVAFVMRAMDRALGHGKLLKYFISRRETLPPPEVIQ